MLVKCPCNNCSGHLEFESGNVGVTVPCPHCGLDTRLFTPQVPLQPAEAAHLDHEQSLLQLPQITDESLRAIQIPSSDGLQSYSVNLVEYTCTCPDFVKVHANTPEREVGRMCKHICRALNNEQILPLLSPICLTMVLEGHGIHPGKSGQDENGNPVYVTGANSQGWLNVFALKRRNGKTYYRFGYNVIEHRWAYGQKPKIDERIVVGSRRFDELKPPPISRSTAGRVFAQTLTVAGRIILLLIRVLIGVAGGVLKGLLSSGNKSRRRRTW